jgi:N-acetylglucosamine kinase-like BadF-type ATPase
MSPLSSAYYLGVDGGGSKTLAVVVDSAGRECGRGMAGSSNQEAVGHEQAVAALHAAIGLAVAAADAEMPLRAAWLGLAGVDHAHDVDALLPQVHSFASMVRITNDAELVLGALPGRIGVALIAGTGSIAMGRDAHGSTARVGGWGHIFGDEGSGYSIGRAALQHAARAADGRDPTTALLDSILAHWSLNAPELLLARVYQSFDKTAIAALAPLVLALAHDGDPLARRIEMRAARELALAVTTIACRLCFPLGLLPLAFGGGLLVHEAHLRECVVRQIARAWSIEPAAELVVVEEPASSAARALVNESDA